MKKGVNDRVLGGVNGYLCDPRHMGGLALIQAYL